MHDELRRDSIGSFGDAGVATRGDEKAHCFTKMSHAVGGWLRKMLDDESVGKLLLYRSLRNKRLEAWLLHVCPLVLQ